MANAPQVDEAIQLADRGDKVGAQRTLAAYLQSNPNDEFAWLWLAYLLPERAQQQQALQQCLKFFPDSQGARDDLDSLRLGASLSRPIPPAPYSAQASSAFLDRDLFMSDSTPEPGASSSSDVQYGSGMMDASGLESRASASEPQSRLVEPRLKRPAPKPEEAPLATWERMIIEEPAPAPVTDTLAPKKKPAQTAAKVKTGRPARKKKSAFKVWQIGCLSLLALITLAVILVGGWYIFSSASGGNPLSFLQSPVETPSLTEESLAGGEATPGNGAEAVAQPAQEKSPTAPSIVPTRTAIPEVVATALPPTPTPTPLPSISLPSPLYFIADAGGVSQIFRLAANGSSLVQVTSEKHPVTAFDVNPADGRLAYISDNSLFLINADGSKRSTLVYGQSLPALDDPSYWKLLLASPVWSPDGGLLAYAQEGIQVIDPDTTVTKRIEPNLYVPSQPERTRIYSPLAWSPEGTRIAVSVMRSTCSTLGIVFATGYSTIDQIAIPGGYPIWSSDGLSLLVSSPFADCTCGSGSGLYQVDPANGKSNVILGGLVQNNASSAFVGWPKLMSDGTLLYFYGELKGPACTPVWPSAVPLAMVVSPGLGKTASRIELRTDSYIIGEALWAPDGSLAVIRDLTQDAQAEFSPLLILNGDGSLAIELSMPGRNLRWGVTAP